MGGLLRAIPPSIQVRCKDRRVLEVLLNLAEAQLLPYPGAVGDVSNLLRATTRLLEARGLYAQLPKFPIDFLFRSASGLLRGEPDTVRLMAEMLAVCVGIVSLRDASGADDHKLEKAARTHFHASGGTACVFDLLRATAGADRSGSASAASGVEGLDDVVCLLALRVLEALLTLRPSNTEYPIVLAILQHAVELAPEMLRLVDHANERVRHVA